MSVTPLIKWPGGKSDELPLILPRLSLGPGGRLVDPFLGGGAVAWNRPPGAGLVAGDACEGTALLHSMVGSGDPGLERALEGVLRVWEAASAADAARAAEAFRPGSGQALLAAERAARARSEARGLERAGDEDRMSLHFWRRASYEWARSLHNAGDPDPARRAALFWATRELCYGGMFRVNAAGRMNVPYGGLSYDRRDLRAKFSLALAPARRALMAGADVARRDFANTLSLALPGDAVFLDPPYDSPFSAYDGNAFGPAQHERLARTLSGLPRGVSWLAVVGETPLTLRLYADHPRALRVERFAKTYRANIRGRHGREAVHLFVTGG